MTPPKIVPCALVSRGSMATRIAGSEFINGIVKGKRKMVNENHRPRRRGPPRNKGFSAVSKGVVEFPTERLMIMFQLVELILASPIGAFVFARLQDALYAILVLSDCDD